MSLSIARRGLPAVVLALVAFLAGCTAELGGRAEKKRSPARAAGPAGPELWIVERPRAAPPPGTKSSDAPLRSYRRTEADSPGGDPSPGAPDLLPPGGELRARLADRSTIVLPLKHTDVKAEVAVYVASVRVRQEYHNPYAEKIEAVYVFPLPDDAAVTGFVMTIGERQIRGIVREREEARRIYDEAKRQGYVASLLTEERPNVFAQSVANIEPGKRIDVDITYFHALRWSEGEYELVFPMVVGPRYNPCGHTQGIGAVAAGATGSSGQRTEVEYLRPEVIGAHDISLRVDIDAGAPIGAIASPSHEIQVTRQGEGRATVELSPSDRIPNKDFVVRYKVGGDGIRAALAAHRDASGGYFTLVLHPPRDLSEIPAPPREMVFVLDCSGSMSGEPLAKAKAAARSCLARLRPCDAFQVIRFSDSASSLGPAPVPATAANVRAGLDYLDSLESEGGTQMLSGIRAALDFPHDPQRFRIVAFLTDGYIGNDREILGEVKRRAGAARLFSMGVGSSVNRYLLEGMARLGRGAVAYVGPDEPDARLVEGFFRRVEHPAMTDIRLEWSGVAVSDVYPREAPDLFAGRPVVLTGRFQGAGRAALRVVGNVGGKPREITVPLDLERPDLRHPALASLWARSRIADLADRATWAPYPGEEAAAIRHVALEYGLVSDYTSFVAVDSLERTRGDHGTTVIVPADMPRGVRYETTVGER